MNFENFFSRRRIIEKLIRIRAGLAAKNHSAIVDSYLLSDRNILPNSCHEVYQLLPPRGKWMRPEKPHRDGVPARDNMYALRMTIDKWAKPKYRNIYPWVNNLEEFICRIRERALACSGVRFTRPSIGRIPKKNGGIRAVVLLNLEDRVLDSLFCDYLRSCFDRFFSDKAFAYRARKAKQPAPTHNDAILSLIKYINAFFGYEKWVAECDIESFFDSLSHQVIRKSISNFLLRNNLIVGRHIDPRAMLAIDAYLASYNFNRDIFSPQSADPAIPKCKWATEALALFHQDLSNEPIGIPQGGAISTVLANIVLDNADRAVLGPGNDPQLFYARYSDDIIIVHTNRDSCQAALDRYLAIMSNLKLPVHRPQSVGQYSKQFWSYKSKSPYRWDNDITREATSPWLSFVGYQIHASYMIRVRPKSIKTEIEKQAKIIRSTIYKVRFANSNKIAIRKSLRNIVLRTRMRLIAMAVGGKKKTWHKRGSSLSYCWTAAVSALRYMKHDRSQLQTLDFHRERLIAKLRRWLAANLIEQQQKTHSPEYSKAKPPRFFGYPFSYAAPFDKLELVSSCADCQGGDASKGCCPEDNCIPPDAANKP